MSKRDHDLKVNVDSIKKTKTEAKIEMKKTLSLTEYKKRKAEYLALKT